MAPSSLINTSNILFLAIFIVIAILLYLVSQNPAFISNSHVRLLPSLESPSKSPVKNPLQNSQAWKSKYLAKSCQPGDQNCELANQKLDLIVAMTPSKEQWLDCRFLRGFGGDEQVQYGWYGQKIYQLCMDRPYRIATGNCVVFSFGIANDWAFEDHISKSLKCRTYAFDPSMEQKHHVRPSGVIFYPFGIHSADEERDPLTFNTVYQNKGSTKWTLKTLGGMAKFLHHENEIIDVVKIDAEESEYESLWQAMEEGFLQKFVGHLILEWHIFENRNAGNFARYLEIYERLHRCDSPKDGCFGTMTTHMRTVLDNELFMSMESMVNMRLYNSTSHHNTI